MRNILLTAKYLAHKEKSEEITKEHIVQALNSVNFFDFEVKEEILEYLDLEETQSESLITLTQLQEVSDLPKIKYSEEAKGFVQFLKEEGYSTNQQLTKLNENFAFNSKKLIELGQIKERLSNIIYDQEIAIESVKDVISRAIFEQREESVKAILFFVGPPATGKTFLSEQTGEILKEYGYTTKVFNMTMYSEEISNLTGLRKPYAGAGRGDLTQFLEENPKSLIVFDEIEKCNLQKQQDLFRLLDRGFIEDKFDNSIVSAKEAILIFTSNLGKSIYERNDYTSMIQNQKETESLLLDAISKEKNEEFTNRAAITPPLVSRLSASRIVLFNKVGLKAYYRMSEKEIERYFTIIQEKFDVALSYSKEAVLASFLKYLPFFDPRRIKGKIGDDLFDVFRDFIQSRQIDLSKIKSFSVDVSKEVKTFLEQNFIKDIENLTFDDRRFQEVVDKKLTFSVEYSYEASATQLKILFTHPKLEKIKNIQDFSGDVKIELDIPSGKIEGEPNANIFGHDDAKRMLVRIAKKIKSFQNLRRENSAEATKVLNNIPKGILLYGPPGTGKNKISSRFCCAG